MAKYKEILKNVIVIIKKKVINDKILSKKGNVKCHTIYTMSLTEKQRNVKN